MTDFVMEKRAVLFPDPKALTVVRCMRMTRLCEERSLAHAGANNGKHRL